MVKNKIKNIFIPISLIIAFAITISLWYYSVNKKNTAIKEKQAIEEKIKNIKPIEPRLSDFQIDFNLILRGIHPDTAFLHSRKLSKKYPSNIIVYHSDKSYENNTIETSLKKYFSYLRKFNDTTSVFRLKSVVADSMEQVDDKLFLYVSEQIEYANYLSD